MKLKKILLTACIAMIGLGMASCGASSSKSNINSNGDDSSQTGGESGNPSGGQTGEESENPSGGAGEATPGEIKTQGDVKILSSTGYCESASIEFNAVAGATDYDIYDGTTKLDAKGKYVQKTSDGTMRADVFGLKKGTHNIKVVPVGGTNTNSSTVSVEISAYDRSGYAHFKSNEGVGAYNNDGTLKDNAIVIYVTDETKNTVELTYNGTTVKGIGNILNSAGMKCGESGHEDQCKKVSDGKTIYGQGNENAGILRTLAQNNIPLVVRIVGCVSNSGLGQQGTFNANTTGLIEGLTAYSSNDFGGTVGDNGHMARMKSAKDVTIEGVGTDATMDGWGIHFMCESAFPELGKSFEARNLSFINTPEDALGMEGVETESTMTLTAPVERCWVHHNSFFCPNISSPAESDKAQGDGSCDFKRGNYFTLAYNYFEKCHKTNLMGSSKTSVQYHISFHHNIWNECGARQPLVRNSNIHMYNNYFIGSTDYVTSVRANAYVYSENNYYLGCKNPVANGGEGGTVGFKSYNDVLVACYEDYEATVVTDREQTVNSTCRYANFDTNSEVFYYNSATKTSDCYMTDAATARIECLKTAGSLARTELNKAALSTTTNIVNLESAANIELSNDTETLTIAKTKGILKVFTLKKPALISFEGTGTSGYKPGYIVKMDGTYVCAAGATGVVAEPGVYVVLAGQYDPTGKNSKEGAGVITFTKYDSSEYNQKAIQAYEDAVAAIGTVEYTEACFNKINAAKSAYNVLSAELKAQITTQYATVEAAYNSFKALGVAAVEQAISAIGTVDANSSAKIIAARDQYAKLMTMCSDAVVSNTEVLINAEKAFQGFALTATVDAINAIGTVTLNSADKITEARKLYDGLTEAQQAQVTNLATLTAAEAKIANLKATDAVDKLISACDLTSVDSMTNVIDGYEKLTADQKALIADAAKYSTIKVTRVNVLIDAIGTVTAQSKVAITAARNAYNALTEAEKATITSAQYAKLTAAETAISGMISEYTYTKDLSAVTTTYSDDAIACAIGEIKDGAAIIRKSKNNSITIKAVKGSSKTTITINAACLDSSDAKDVEFVVTYADGSSESKIIKTTTGKKYSDLVLSLEGKIITNVVIKGIDSKQLGITSIKVVYEK